MSKGKSIFSPPENRFFSILFIYFFFDHCPTLHGLMHLNVAFLLFYLERDFVDQFSVSLSWWPDFDGIFAHIISYLCSMNLICNRQ